ncbi:hypothetical protein [Alterisphingorhabdus coralli]|uniref:DUF883 domain-containing protein n=1 Tax=Alterisphingorhabdus coralli TaxID=3071408 RepID=A0AA97I0D7_9SPHN|nr:hypothetical protein [Parasphingorhabdus sp. SCSIO 66989]WOE74085.1 hypothetical protein RB602_09470 [Parasphingorhabdus sp. SCSIO 66989]
MSEDTKSGTGAAKPKTTARKTSAAAKKKTTTRKTTASKKTATTAKKPAAKKSTALVATKAAANENNFAEDTKAKAAELANDAKGRISEAIANLGGLIGDSAGAIDERLGSRFGDMARTASDNVTSAAKKVDESDLGELADETREFVRKSPALAVGIAAAAGFVVARLFKSASNNDN